MRQENATTDPPPLAKPLNFREHPFDQGGAMNDTTTRDHGGGIDAAIARFGGTRSDWLDLSTGINPVPYPLPDFSADSWTALPDQAAQTALTNAARRFWDVPDEAEILAAPGASALIARLPALFPKAAVDIPKPTYNEHAAAFTAQGWTENPKAQTRVLVHPNNPTGSFWCPEDIADELTIIDESFCDIAPERSMIAETARPNVVILKSFGKFWGLAGLRLGFLIGNPDIIAKMRDHIGPWAVSGPALQTGAQALCDDAWADKTRIRLAQDARRLDDLILAKGAKLVGGCSLFRLYEVDNAQTWQAKLAQNHIWSRIFPYSKTYLRLGLPAPDRWHQLETALER